MLISACLFGSNLNVNAKPEKNSGRQAMHHYQ